MSGDLPSSNSDSSTARQSSNPTRTPHLDRVSSDSIKSIALGRDQGLISKAKRWSLARHSLGIILLLVTVFLWTASNFLASTIFADNSYSKPYFVTYINSSFFAVFLVFVAFQRYSRGERIWRTTAESQLQPLAYEAVSVSDNDGHPKYGNEEGEETTDAQRRLLLDDSMTSIESLETPATSALNDRETAWLSFQFCLLWFLANYFVAACLEYTTVASSTILTSTSSIWTLIMGASLKVEAFTVRKLLGCLTSLAGIALISSVDLTANNDKNRGDFPHKSHKELAVGDVLALASALMYGIYTTLMKKKIGDESRVNMPLFFGFVGLFNLGTLLPGLVFVHYTGIETFQLPPTARITTIVLVNSATSLVSDFCWAYSMLLTSPLVITVGLSLTIPLSLFGQMIVNGQTSTAMYWIGAVIVVFSFVFINHQSKESAEEIVTSPGHEGHRQGRWAFAWRIWDRRRPRHR